MRVQKNTEAGQGLELDGRELAMINELSRRDLKAEEVYAFGVRLCDNEVDRDWERFTPETLEELARLFVGKSGIFDHQWSAMAQTARIYRTELAQEDTVLTQAGDGYRYLKGYAYMLRTEGNRDLIAEIEGGIKKEVSVGCAVRRSVCSICGADTETDCGHVRGQEYGGQLCFAELSQATDAYEWSFVAVPAQRRAGVMKGFGDQRAELERQAALGRKYVAGLKAEVARLGGLAEPDLDTGVLRGIADRLEEWELLELKRVYEKRVEGRFPIGVQLKASGEKLDRPNGYPLQRQGDGVFVI